MKKYLSLVVASILALAPMYANEKDITYFEDCCQVTPIMPAPTNCADAEIQKIGMSMMGFGLALIAAIAIVAGTYSPSLASSSSSSSSSDSSSSN
ncbi:MAG: hypothetical protein H7A39_06070 [Chlamydiales bacterium]|nr:hypothetical protein [Chlamydiales bacterium]